MLMSDISALGFGSTVNTLSDALSGADMEQNALSNNIANVNTPGYHRQSVSFKDALAAAQGTQPSPDELGMVTDSDRQFAIGGVQAPQPYDPQVQVDDTDQMRVDGSNVDLDQSMAEVSQNAAYSQTMSHLLQVQFMRLREAITEQPH